MCPSSVAAASRAPRRRSARDGRAVLHSARCGVAPLGLIARPAGIVGGGDGGAMDPLGRHHHILQFTEARRVGRQRACSIEIAGGVTARGVFDLARQGGTLGSHARGVG